MAAIKYAFKAIFAGLVTFLGGLISALTQVDGHNLTDIDLVGWLTIILATVVAVGGVFGFANGPSPDPEKRKLAAIGAASEAGGRFVADLPAAV